MNDDANQPEALVNPLPAVVVVLALALGAIELVLQAGEAGLIGGPQAVGWRAGLIERFGFNGPLLGQMLDRGVWQADILWRFVTYPFIHGTATHAIISIVFLLAMGKVVGEVFGTLATLAVYFAASALGALAFFLFTDSAIWIIGGLPGAYGLIGGYSFLLWVGLGAAQENQLRAFTLIAFLMGIQLFFGLIFGGGLDWVADLGGFVAGFVLSFLVSPGGWGRVLDRLRQRR